MSTKLCAADYCATRSGLGREATTCDSVMNDDTLDYSCCYVLNHVYCQNITVRRSHDDNERDRIYTAAGKRIAGASHQQICAYVFIP